MVTKKINEVLSFNLPLDVICTSHGVIWRDKPEQIVEKYLKWSDAYQENQITILYDTMWNPDNENLNKCDEYGRELAAKVHL